MREAVQNHSFQALGPGPLVPGPCPLVLVPGNWSNGLGPKITKNQKIHEMGRRGSVCRDISGDRLLRPSRTSWDRSPGLTGKKNFFTPPGALGP